MLGNKWSHKYSRCIKCGNDSIRHEAHGLCLKCYHKNYNTISDYDRSLFTCEYCGVEFYNAYQLKMGYRLRFCSKSCATKSRERFNNEPELEYAICEEIKKANRYLTGREVVGILNISSKKLVRYGVSIIYLNNKCGMRKPNSVFEYRVGRILNDIFSDIVFEKSFSNLKSDKGYLLRFDFYSPSYNLLIEADGDQHYSAHFYYKNTVNLMLNDELKNKWCVDNGVNLVRIKYRRLVNKEYVIKALNPFLNGK